ncbi:MAG TPA: hypothetical protein VJ978_07545 [Nitriliruptoraceae bacterium]|nr:hypothetical protein [Nitriliruptoraceae bacterium]
MTDQRPPHPGTQPERLEFPFGHARAALAAINDVVAQLRDLEQAIDQGVADLHAGAFEGEFSSWFAATGDDLVAQIDSRITELEADADDLEALIEDARQGIRARDISRHHWQQAHTRWANWKPADAAV